MRRFHINSPQVKRNALNAVMEIMQEDNYDVVIEEHKDSQTASQRGFFHVLRDILAKEFGVSPNAMKEDIKREAWGSDIEMVRGKEIEVIRSSAGAQKDEYSELIEVAYRLGAEYGCVLPNPRYNG